MSRKLLGACCRIIVNLMISQRLIHIMSWLLRVSFSYVRWYDDNTRNASYRHRFISGCQLDGVQSASNTYRKQTHRSHSTVNHSPPLEKSIVFAITKSIWSCMPAAAAAAAAAAGVAYRPIAGTIRMVNTLVSLVTKYGLLSNRLAPPSAYRSNDQYFVKFSLLTSLRHRSSGRNSPLLIQERRGAESCATMETAAGGPVPPDHRRRQIDSEASPGRQLACVSRCVLRTAVSLCVAAKRLDGRAAGELVRVVPARHDRPAPPRKTHLSLPVVRRSVRTTDEAAGHLLSGCLLMAQRAMMTRCAGGWKKGYTLRTEN
jgi:hypothetical protein